MDAVLKKIHYNSEVFSKIVEDCKTFFVRTKPGTFYAILGKMAKDFPEAKLICEEMTTDKLKEGIKELENKPEIYLEDFHQVAAILECGHPLEEEEFYKWLNPIPCRLYIFTKRLDHRILYIFDKWL